MMHMFGALASMRALGVFSSWINWHGGILQPRKIIEYRQKRWESHSHSRNHPKIRRVWKVQRLKLKAFAGIARRTDKGSREK